MKILIAPDKFKEASTARETAEAIAAGIEAALPEAELTRCPLADGGDGTGPVLAEALNAEPRIANVRDPRGQKIEATWWYQSNQQLAIIEMAEASGLRLVPPAERKPLKLTTYGTGQLLKAAMDAGASEIRLGCGGSATVDGGVAMMQALGWQMRDASGATFPEPLPPTEFHSIAQIVAPPEQPQTQITILSDVHNPILGPNGAATVFGPQKGADEKAVAQLEEVLTHWVNILTQHTGQPVRDFVCGGAAGGIPSPLQALLGAKPQLGIEQVFKATNIATLLAECDFCVTGEGRLDSQSRSGKVVGQLAAETNAPVIAFVGSVDGDPAELTKQLGLRDIVVITPPDTPLPEALAKTQQNLTHAARDYFANLKP